MSTTRSPLKGAYQVGDHLIDLEWARSLRDQCVGAGVPVCVKQLGRVWARANSSVGKESLMAARHLYGPLTFVSANFRDRDDDGDDHLDQHGDDARHGVCHRRQGGDRHEARLRRTIRHGIRVLPVTERWTSVRR